MAEEGQQTQTSTGDTGQGGGEAKWYDSFTDEALKGNDTIKGFDGIESLAKAHLTVQDENAALKKQIEDSKPVVPDKPEAYELPAKFEGLPDEMAGELSAQLSKIALAAGLTKEQAGKAFAALMADEVQALKDATAEIQRKQGEIKAGLQKDYGDKYEEKLNTAFLRCTEIAGKSGIKADDFKAFLDNTGIGDDPTFIKFAVALADLISPDSMEKNHAIGADKSALDVLYPTMKQK